MNGRNSLVTWLAVGIIALGIMAIVAMTVQSAPETQALPTKAIAVATVVPADTPTPEPPAEVVLPTVTPTLVPLELPAVEPPAGGTVFMIYPQGANAVGWVRSDDETTNHFGDFNIYAGIFQGQIHIGGIRFDLAQLPAGVPILHADLTLMGLSDEYLATGGEWTVSLLEPWIDQDWSSRDYHWLSRSDSVLAPLVFNLTPADLGRAQQNTFFLTPETLPLLAARAYQGSVTFRVTGPTSGENNLFAWDSGFGADSLTRPPLLRIVTGPAPDVAPPSPTPKLVMVTPFGGLGDDIIAEAALRLTAEAQVAAYSGDGTPTPTATATPLPPNWVTPVIITNTPVPENQATAVYQVQVATAQAIVMGTATPLPLNIWTATPTAGPTATRDLIPFADFTATPTPTVTPTGVPPVLAGKILFKSDRFSNSQEPDLMVMNPDGSGVSLWAAGAQDWIFNLATSRESAAPDGRFEVLVSDRELDGVPTNGIGDFQLFVIPVREPGRPERLTRIGMNYDPVWSPTDYRIAYVSTEPGNDEIYTIRPDGTEQTRLTFNSWEWDKHPSWSADGAQIVFWSNRGAGNKQIWIMNADGSAQRNLSSNEFNDWDPVWVK